MKTLVETFTLCALLLASSGAAQEPRPVFRVNAEMVVVDLVATDRAGELVRDLQPSDIQVSEDGRRQTLQFLRLVRGTGSPESPAAPPAGGVVAVPATAGAPAALADTALVIAIDLGSLPAEAMPRLQDAIERLLRDQLPAGPPVMLATLSRGVTIRQPFTTDRAALGAAVKSLRATATQPATLTDVVETIDLACEMPQGGGGGSSPVVNSAIADARALVTESRTRLVDVSESLATLSRSLAAMPGRKHVVFYSAGYFVDPLGDVIEAVTAAVTPCAGPAEARRVRQELTSQRRDVTPALQTAIDRANRSQVSFYAVDARGLMATNIQSQQRGSARMAHSDAVQRAAAIETRTQDYLQEIATSTGGRAYFNSNDIAQGLKQAWLDANEYYLLGYAPSAGGKKGQFHKIQIKVTRPGLSLRYRRGYFEVNDRDMAVTDIEAALRQPGAFESRGLTVETVVRNGKLKISALVTPAIIRFTSSGAKHQASFSLHATLRDSGGAVVGGKPLFGRDVTLTFTNERLAVFRASDNAEIPTEVDVPPPGTYQLTLVVRDSSGLIAARTIALEVGR